LSVNGLNTVSINDGRSVAFSANMSNASIGSAIFVYSHGSLTSIVDDATTSPFGGLFGNFSSPLINNSGAVLYNASGDRDWHFRQHSEADEEEKAVGGFLSADFSSSKPHMKI